MYDLLLTAAAREDLGGIVEYISLHLLNPGAAGTFLDDVEACYKILRRTPHAYAECSDHTLRNKGYRKAVINNYLMIYRVKEESGKVYVLRFFYGGQDYLRLL